MFKEIVASYNSYISILSSIFSKGLETTNSDFLQGPSLPSIVDFFKGFQQPNVNIFKDLQISKFISTDFLWPFRASIVDFFQGLSAIKCEYFQGSSDLQTYINIFLMDIWSTKCWLLQGSLDNQTSIFSKNLSWNL